MGDGSLIDGLVQWGSGRGMRRGYRRRHNPRGEGSDGLYIFYLTAKPKCVVSEYSLTYNATRPATWRGYAQMTPVTHRLAPMGAHPSPMLHHGSKACDMAHDAHDARQAYACDVFGSTCRGMTHMTHGRAPRAP